jgi:hypothetical protein
MAYQKISDLQAKIQTLIDKAQSILELGEGVRYYNNSKYVTFNVKVSLKSIEDILNDLPLPTPICNRFEAEHKWLCDNFLEQQRNDVKEWFTVDHEAALTDELQKRKKSAMWNIDTDNVGFYGRGGGHFTFFKVDFIQQIIDDCEVELKYSTKRDELLDFIERGDYEGFVGRCDDVMWVYENFVKDMTSSIKEDWKAEVLYHVEQIDFNLDEDETVEVIDEITPLITFPFNKIELLTTTKDGVNFIVFLNDNHKLLNRDSFIGLFKCERKNNVTWLDKFDGDNDATVNFLNNRADMLDEMLNTWRGQEWLR